MTSAVATLRLLAAGLRGVPPDPAAWPLVIEMANRSWLVPELRCALAASGQFDGVPEDVLAYLTLLHDRNRSRNARLRGQLEEAVAVLNSVGLEPLLIKGAVNLVTEPEPRQGARMMSDIDLLVPADAAVSAVSALEGVGYGVLHHGGPGRHDYATLGRDRDVGTLDLHVRPPGPARFTAPSDLVLRSRRIAMGGGWAFVPDSSMRVLHLVVHDQILEGDYWLGKIDLRHLHDLALLSTGPEPVDWAHLEDIMGPGVGRRALATQLTTLREVFRIEVPIPASRTAALQHRRRLLQLAHPRLTVPVRLLAKLAWLLVRTRARCRRVVFDRAWFSALPLRLRRLLRRGPAAVLHTLLAGPSRPKV